MSARVAVFLAFVALAGGGCSYNPGYFPWILPPGRIEQTHAKPRGPGYFRNFDPKACKLGVTPSGQANAPLGSQIPRTSPAATTTPRTTWPLNPGRRSSW
jgi:hypothetical protein